MLEMIVDNRLIYVVTGVAAAVGVISKIISNISLKRMVYAAGNMSKSNHPLMRLIRAKFEHACMVSERVENVEVFVDKYLYEYRTVGVKLHTWRRMQILCAGICLAAGLLGAFLEYSVNGMNDEVIRTGAFGGILGVLLYLFHLTTDEEYRLEAARNYIVDYLENVCLHKYEKAHQKEKEVKQEPKPEITYPDPAKEVPSTQAPPEIKPPAMPEPYEVPNTAPPVKAAKEVKKELPKDKDVLIRQILEEFMA